jgi:GNAT superfamily N-acetyltransferase
MRNARYGWTIEKHRRTESKNDAKGFARELENPRWQSPFRYRKNRHQWVVYETLSTKGYPLEVIDIRNGFGLRIAWVHIFHEPVTSIVKELYVWPTFLRRGYGSLLESMAVTRAKIWRARNIQILFHNIDSFLHVRVAGRIFAQRRGYSWKWRESTRPCLSGVAEKTL